MTTTSKMAWGIVGAAAAGVVIGLLIAPQKGEETRKLIRKTAGEWAENMIRFFASEKEKLKREAMSTESRTTV